MTRTALAGKIRIHGAAAAFVAAFLIGAVGGCVCG